jgi:hypothetical protein
MRIRSFFALCLLSLAAACSSALPTVPSEVEAPVHNTQGGTGNGDG